ncbi:TPA: WGR and DUF4132 domain-containing protein [Klebsiella oxytoca]|nr:WGR and DUF4132 domain-containing protein [Klebsiella oxytoca]
MKTFIYQDEKSHKFWAVEQQDNELHLSWGKVGTSGQKQIKTFADAAAASKARQKLINEKAKKGYVENSAAEASMPAPQQTAASAGSPPWLKDDEPIILDPDYETNAYSNRRFTDEPLKPVNEDCTLWEMLKESEHWPPFFLTCLQHFDASACRREWQQALQEAMRRIKQQQSEGSLLSDTILTLARFVLHYPIRIDVWLDGIVQQRGVEYAVDLVIALQQVQMTDQTNSDPVTNKVIEDGYERLLMILRNGQSAQTSPLFAITLSHNITDLRFEHGFSKIDLHLRKHLSQADATTWQRCADKLIAALPSIAPRRRPLVAFLLPEKPEIANRLALELAPDNDFPELEWLNIVATDPQAVQQLARFRQLNLFTHYRTSERCIETLLREQSLAGLSRLTPLIHEYRIKRALVEVNHPQAMTLLMMDKNASDADHLDSFAKKHPEAALYALTQGLVNGKNAIHLRLLEQVVLGNPQALESAGPWLTAEQQQLLFNHFPQLVATEEIASPDDQPPVLRSPPWLAKKKKTAAVALTLQVLPLESMGPEPEPLQEEEVPTTAEVLRYLGFESFYFDRDNPAPERFDCKWGVSKTAISLLEKEDYESLLNTRQKYDYESYITLHMSILARLPEEKALSIWNAMTHLHLTGIDEVVHRFGLPTLPGLLRYARIAPKEAVPLAAMFAASEAAPLMARAFCQLKSLRDIAERWLLTYPEHAITGLLPAALGKSSKEQGDARMTLRFLVSSGHLPLMEQVARRYDQPEVMTALGEMLAADPLDNYPLKIAKLPEWCTPEVWHRPILHNGKALSDDAIRHLCTMLAFPREETLYPGIVQVQEACTPRSLADFAWDLFQSWEIVSGSAKDNWGFTALGIFGNDDTVRRLTPLIRAWPGESQHKRATVGLDILAAIGSDIALMQLNGIALKIKFKALQEAAREKIKQIADKRELTIAELEDRLAPDLGLDDSGTLTLDFGPRRFTLGFDEALKPFVRDESGRRLKDLPKPGKSDNEPRAAEAVSRYRQLKKDVRTVASQQIMRLVSAMCLRRRWTAEQFRLFLVDHPLVRHLTRRLVWGVYSQENVLLACFRVAEDNSYSDAQDNPINLHEGQIGLPHVLEISAEDAAAFGQLFADYELLPPFRQLDRNAYRFSQAESETFDLQRWAGRKALSGRVVGLVSKGWQRGEVRDAGGVYTFYKPVDGGYVELEVFPGFTVGLSVDMVSKTQGISHIRLYKAGQRKMIYPFSSLDKIAASELINDIESLFD